MGLFSTTHIHQNSRKEYVPYDKTVTVHEHKAPTDKSVELFNEMTEKAKQNIVDKIHLKSNTLEAITVFFAEDSLMDAFNYYLRFVLNGQEVKINGRIERRDLYSEFDGYNESIIRFIYKKFAESVAQELIRHTDLKSLLKRPTHS